MKRKAVFEIILTLLLTSMIPSAFLIRLVKTGGTIYIRADGSIEPVTAPIQRDGDVYTFTDNIYDSIVVERSSIIIDGCGYTLQGPADANGFSLSNVAKVTIKNTDIRDFWYGIYLIESFNIILSGNNITHNHRGVMIYQCSDIRLYENHVASNDEQGVIFQYSSYNVLRNNSLSGPRAFDIGSLLGWSSFSTSSQYFHDIDESNTINGKPIYYLVNRINIEVPSNAGFVALVNCQNITVKGTLLENDSPSMLLRNVSNSRIINNTIANNVYAGVYLHESFDNVFYGNNITNNDYGINLFKSSGNGFYENNIINNREMGAYLYWSSNNRLSKNNIMNNTDNGVTLFKSHSNTFFENNIMNNTGHGIDLGVSSGNILRGNNIINNGWHGGLTESGVYLYGTGNVLYGNNIAKNNEGIRVFEASENKFFHNNIMNNRIQVSIDGYSNTWDDGYPSGGNYWSEYTYADLFSGPNQDQPGSDGVGDTPIIMNTNNIDRFPLMAPINIFDAGTWNGTSYSVDVVSNSTVSDFYFNPDEGAFLRFNVTGENGTTGFSRVVIAKQLMWVEDGWNVTVNGQSVNYTIIPDENHTYLYFTYNHSTKTVLIQGAHVIPEFPQPIIQLLLAFATLIATILLKKKRRPKSPQLF